MASLCCDLIQQNLCHALLEIIESNRMIENLTEGLIFNISKGEVLAMTVSLRQHTIRDGDQDKHTRRSMAQAEQRLGKKGRKNRRHGEARNRNCIINNMVTTSDINRGMI